MMRAGAAARLDIVAGTANSRWPGCSRYQGHVETGTALSQAFRKYPYFDSQTPGVANSRHPGRPARPAGDLQGKDAGDRARSNSVHPMSVIIVAGWC
jgi:hypothetical protein